MLLAVSFQRMPNISFNLVLNQVAQFLNGAVPGLLCWKGHQLAMPPEQGHKEDSRPVDPQAEKACQSGNCQPLEGSLGKREQQDLGAKLLDLFFTGN